MKELVNYKVKRSVIEAMDQLLQKDDLALPEEIVTGTGGAGVKAEHPDGTSPTSPLLTRAELTNLAVSMTKDSVDGTSEAELCRIIKSCCSDTGLFESFIDSQESKHGEAQAFETRTLFAYSDGGKDLATLKSSVTLIMGFLEECEKMAVTPVSQPPAKLAKSGKNDENLANLAALSAAAIVPKVEIGSVSEAEKTGTGNDASAEAEAQGAQVEVDGVAGVVEVAESEKEGDSIMSQEPALEALTAANGGGHTTMIAPSPSPSPNLADEAEATAEAKADIPDPTSTPKVADEAKADIPDPTSTPKVADEATAEAKAEIQKQTPPEIQESAPAPASSLADGAPAEVEAEVAGDEKDAGHAGAQTQTKEVEAEAVENMEADAEVANKDDKVNTSAALKQLDRFRSIEDEEKVKLRKLNVKGEGGLNHGIVLDSRFQCGPASVYCKMTA